MLQYFYMHFQIAYNKYNNKIKIMSSQHIFKKDGVING